MVQGKLIDPRKLRENEVETFHNPSHGDVARHGPFWPSGREAFASLAVIQKRYQEDGSLQSAVRRRETMFQERRIHSCPPIDQR